MTDEFAVPTIEQFEKAARRWCELKGLDPESPIKLNIWEPDEEISPLATQGATMRWRAVADYLREQWIVIEALEVEPCSNS